jgi:hypothetical protein
MPDLLLIRHSASRRGHTALVAFSLPEYEIVKVVNRVG